jgi:hypothetical protein
MTGQCEVLPAQSQESLPAAPQLCEVAGFSCLRLGVNMRHCRLAFSQSVWKRPFALMTCKPTERSYVSYGFVFLLHIQYFDTLI